MQTSAGGGGYSESSTAIQNNMTRQAVQCVHGNDSKGSDGRGVSRGR